MDIKFRGNQEQLFELVTDSRLRQADLARLMGIAPATINRYATLKREVPEDLFNRILDLCAQAKAAKDTIFFTCR